MPIASVDVRAGDPQVQASGEYRGVVDVTFTDERVVMIALWASSLDEWNDKVAAVYAEAQERMAESDAPESVDIAQAVDAKGEADIKSVAVAYLRAAWNTQDVHEAYTLFTRFNTYRLAQGWSLTQVQAGLASAGLTVEEWDKMRTAYTYLNSAGRPAIMSDAKSIQAYWDNR